MTNAEKLSLAGVSIASGLLIGYSIQLVRMVRLAGKQIEVTIKKQELQREKELIGPKLEEVERLCQEIEECSDEEVERRESLTNKAKSLLDELEAEIPYVNQILEYKLFK